MRNLTTVVTTALVTAAMLLVLAAMPAGGAVRATLGDIARALGSAGAPAANTAALPGRGAGADADRARDVRARDVLATLADNDFAEAGESRGARVLGPATVEGEAAPRADGTVQQFARMLARSVEEHTRGPMAGAITVSGATSQGGNGWRVPSGNARSDGLSAFGLAWAAFTLAILMLITRRWQ